MKNQDVTMIQLIWDKQGTKAFPYIPCPHATIKLISHS